MERDKEALLMFVKFGIRREHEQGYCDGTNDDDHCRDSTKSAKGIQGGKSRIQGEMSGCLRLNHESRLPLKPFYRPVEACSRFLSEPHTCWRHAFTAVMVIVGRI